MDRLCSFVLMMKLLKVADMDAVHVNMKHIPLERREAGNALLLTKVFYLHN